MQQPDLWSTNVNINVIPRQINKEMFRFLNFPPVLDWRDVPSFRASDSGQVGFLRYPHTGQESGSIEQRHPGLSRAGAGL